MENQTNEKPVVYLLSTCPRCRKVKQVLEDKHVDCEKIMVDLLSQIERNKVIDLLRKHRPIISFPVIQSEGEFIFAANSDDVERLFGEE